MKTLDEVIKALEVCTSDRGGCGECPFNDNCKPDDKWDDALFYLKEYRWIVENCAETLAEKYSSENIPLTWDELKTMIGKPVWVEYNFQIGDKEFRDKSKRWCIIREFKPWENTEITITENGFVLSKREQIKAWQAYRKERE